MVNALTKDLKISFIFFSLFMSSIWAQQQVESNFLLSMDGIISSEDNNPFWLSHNNYYKISLETTYAGFAQWKGNYALNEQAGLYTVISGYYRNGVSDEFQRKELNISYINRWLKVTLGSEARKDPTNGLSSTGKNFLWSPNARPLPGIILEAIDPLKISRSLSLDWGIGHYLLNDDRYIDNTMVHYKRLALLWNINEKNAIRGQLQHFAQWGGTSPQYGKLESNFEAFVDVFFASQPTSSIIEGEAVNALGNHLGSYLFDYIFTNSVGDFSIYHEHPFEDGSGTGFANFPDGVWGIYFQPEQKNIIKGILYEYVDTSNQSANQIGNDNYFSNNLYRSGWTYERNSIGTPFFLIDRDVEIDQTNSPILRNRIKAHHLGLSGTFKRVDWQIKSSYVQLLPRFQQEEDPTFNFWYHYIGFDYATLKHGTFQINIGLDIGNEIDTTFGVGLGYSYAF
jgi:Capsule assembly protein Wzi